MEKKAGYWLKTGTKDLWKLWIKGLSTIFKFKAIKSKVYQKFELDTIIFTSFVGFFAQMAILSFSFFWD